MKKRKSKPLVLVVKEDPAKAPPGTAPRRVEIPIPPDVADSFVDVLDSDGCEIMVTPAPKAPAPEPRAEVDGSRPPFGVQTVPIVITDVQRELLLEFVNQHLVSMGRRSAKDRTEHAARCLLSFACALPPATFGPIIRYLCRYGTAEGFDHFYLLDQLAIGALALWRGDTSGTKGLRMPSAHDEDSKMRGMTPEELLAKWRRDMDEEEKRETIEMLKLVASGLEADLKGGGLQP